MKYNIVGCANAELASVNYSDIDIAQSQARERSEEIVKAMHGESEVKIWHENEDMIKPTLEEAKVLLSNM